MWLTARCVPLDARHIHLHIISTDFRGEYMRSKKHLNSFHPTLGFFIHLDDVLSWFGPDIEPTWFAIVSTPSPRFRCTVPLIAGFTEIRY